jgi:hypothetical protein
MYLIPLEILILCSEINLYFNNYNKYLLISVIKNKKKWGLLRSQWWIVKAICINIISYTKRIIDGAYWIYPNFPPIRCEKGWIKKQRKEGKDTQIYKKKYQ